MKTPLTLFTMHGCPYCIRAKNQLHEAGIDFEEIVIDYSDDAAWERIYERCGGDTVPQLFDGDQYIGDHKTIAEFFKTGRLRDYSN